MTSHILKLIELYLHKTSQIFTNYDLANLPSGPGTSPYTAMNNEQTKSIEEWRKKNKKRQKANEKKITQTKLVPEKKAATLTSVAEKLEEKWLSELSIDPDSLSQEDIHPDGPDLLFEPADERIDLIDKALAKKREREELEWWEKYWQEQNSDSLNNADDLSTLARKLNGKWLQKQSAFAGTLDDQIKVCRKLLTDFLTEISFLMYSKDLELDQDLINKALQITNHAHQLLFEAFDEARETPDVWLVLKSAHMQIDKAMMLFDEIIDPALDKAEKIGSELLEYLEKAKDLATLEEGSIDEESRLTQQVDVDVDQLSRENLHPNMPDYEDPIETAQDWEDVGNRALFEKKYPLEPDDDADDHNAAKTHRTHISEVDPKTVEHGKVLWLKGWKSDQLIPFLDTLVERGLSMKYFGPGDRYVVVDPKEPQEEWDDTYLTKSEENDADDQNHATPKGWKKTVEKMKRHKEITNPFALSWWMKQQGDKPHPHKK